MESIESGPTLFTSRREVKYLRAVLEQKTLQRNTQASQREIALAQKNVADRAKKYGRELVVNMMTAPHVIRKYAVGAKYVLECITPFGQINIYSHPKNTSVKPKMEVHHVRGGFITWWHESDCDDALANLWNDLCTRGNFDPTDCTEVMLEEQRAASIAREV